MYYNDNVSFGTFLFANWLKFIQYITYLKQMHFKLVCGSTWGINVCRVAQDDVISDQHYEWINWITRCDTDLILIECGKSQLAIV